MRTMLSAVFVILVLGASPCGMMASGPGSSSWNETNPAPAKSDYETAKGYLKRGQYKEAEALLKKAQRDNPDNPDVLNLLAFSQRKQGRLEDAFANYEKALRLRPEFPEAREYLGEAHLQAVLQQVETLRSYGPAGQESLKELSEAVKNAAANL